MYRYYKLPLNRMKSFINYSGKIGNNFLLVQGPGGNTSMKENNHILIKKSGFLLSDSSTKNIFKKINFENISKFYNGKNPNNKKFHPELSIEAPLHVLLNSKYVFHYHSIASIVVSSIYNKKELNSLLLSNNILPINYIRPGIELAQEIILKNNKHNFSLFFLYNHGFIIEENNVSVLYKKIFEIESLFSKLINYKKLRNLSSGLVNLNLTNNKIENPFPKIDYKKFNGKYLFPDHSVFFPNFFTDVKNKNELIYYDKDYFYFNKRLTETELTYFKTLLAIYALVNDKEIVNFIKKDKGLMLRNSNDEKLRIEASK